MILWRSLDPKILVTVLASAIRREVKSPTLTPAKPASAGPVEDAVA